MFKKPITVANHPGVSHVVPGGDQGSDRKYWVFFREEWGYYEYGQRDAYYWISGGCGVDTVKEFLLLGLERR